MVAKRRKAYAEIQGELNAETAYIQAAHALDTAAYLAEENRDVEGLLTVAQTYVAIGERLTPGYHAEDGEEESETPFGFCTTAVAEDEHEPFEEVEAEEEDEDAVSDSLRIKLEV